MSFSTQIENTIRDFGLIHKNQSILIGISGGVDSTVLAHVLVALGYKISLAHVNYHLRDKASEMDQQFVKDFAKKYGIKIYTKSIRLKSKKESTQTEARNQRYLWFKELMKKNGYKKIALGHNADDNFETALFHLIKGEGILNKRGIPIKSGPFVRPLIFSSRKEIVDYAKKEGLAWREDQSNAELKYHRNFLRNKIVPLLSPLNPSVERSFQRDYLRDMELKNLAEKDFKTNQSWIIKESGKIRLELKTLKKQPAWYTRLEYFLSGFGYSSEKFWELKKLIDADTGKSLLMGEFQLWKDRADLILLKASKLKPLKSFEVKKLPFKQKTIAGTIGLKTVSISKSGIKKNNSEKVLLDSRKLKLPCIIRPWKTGDKFIPLGMKGKKKISDFLIDQKIPLSEKEKIYVLEAGGEIAWVIGFRISERFKLEGDSKKAVEGHFFP